MILKILLASTMLATVASAQTVPSTNPSGTENSPSPSTGTMGGMGSNTMSASDPMSSGKTSHHRHRHMSASTREKMKGNSMMREPSTSSSDPAPKQ